MTRKQLIEFLNKTASDIYSSFYPDSLTEIIADALIKEGFCKVDEPREFWLVRHLGAWKIHTTEVPTYAVDSQGNELEIIHVREVVEE